MALPKDGETPRYYVPARSSMAIFSATALAMIALGAASGMNAMHSADASGSDWLLLYAGLIALAIVLACWFSLTIKENIKGMNSEQLKISYRIGMQWFIFSEVMFFAAFFGVLFYVRTLAGPWLSGEGAGVMNTLLWPGFDYSWPLMDTPQDAIGGVKEQAKAGFLANNGEHTGPQKNLSWPGLDNLFHWLPFWNTTLLVLSSIWLEFAHHALKKNKRTAFNFWLGLTLLFGFVFVYLQYLEYHEAYVDYGLYLNSGIYGATFFMLTGFHGFHVIMGAGILTVQFFRSVMKKHFTKEDHFGFEAASWYWHFVDVVWIFLVAVVYVY
ncbi:MAG: cytochrome c oxidase subunit 3 [Cellvibrionales bacterium]|nr:cytochrome c oxidase subunit 3 [Cellvibrionales bacterium]